MSLGTYRLSNKTTSLFSAIVLLLFLPFLLFGVYQTVYWVSRAAGIKANIIVDSKTVQGLISTDFYHAFAQGGEEAQDMLAPILPELKALKPKVIRLDHIFDHYDVVEKSGDSLSFNFSKLDQAVETILKTGAKPVLALSYMPKSIAQDSIVINPPNNWNDWSQVVQRTIEHYSGKSEKNISGIYYEVWNEPDLEIFGSWKLTEPKNYLTLYKYASIGARNAQNTNSFALCGPATTGMYTRWITALVTSGNRVDCLSWHSYLPDPEQYDRDQRNLIKVLLKYPKFTLVPKLITEYGFTGAKDKRYGTRYGAAYTASAIRFMIQSPPTYAFSFQPKDGPGQESGDGWGFITHETNGKRKKPRYDVFNFIDAMEGNSLKLKGEGTWVKSFATTKNGLIKILLVNFDPKGSHTEEVPIAITSLSPGRYTFTQRFITGQQATFTETLSNNILRKKILMPAQSVAIIEVKKL